MEATRKYVWGLISKRKDETHTIWSLLNFPIMKIRRKNKYEESIIRIERKIDELCKFIVIKECFPGIIKQSESGMQIPLKEGGNRFVDYFFEWRQEYRFVKRWINELECSINHIQGGYQSDSYSMDDWYRVSFKLIQESDFFIASKLIFDIISMQIQCSDPKDQCLEFCQMIMSGDILEKTATPGVWVKIISFYIAKKYEAKARELCERFIKRFGYRRESVKQLIKRWIAVAELMDRMGVCGFEKEARVFRIIEGNNKKYSLQDILKDKRIAIVGNGPQENGTNNGAKIDSYDVVIRMNDYNLSEQYIRDYGEKVTIWSRIPQEQPSLRLRKGHPKYRYIAWPITNFPFEDDIVQQYLDEIDHGNILFSRLNDEQSALCKDLGLMHPSSGLCLIYSVKKINPYFSHVDCYGFSFKDTGKTKWLNADGRDIGGHNGITIHNLELERKVLRNMFNMTN